MSRRNKASTVDVIEAAYAPAASDTEWLSGLRDAAAPIVSDGLGILAQIYEGATGPLRAGAVAAVDLPVPLEVFTASLEQFPPEFVDLTWRSLGFGLCSEMGPLTHVPFGQTMMDAGIADVLNVNAFDPSGVGVTLAVPLRAVRERSPSQATTWTRVAAHLGSALRLLRRHLLQPSPDTAAAVISTKGRLEHAADDNAADRIRVALEDAVVRMERARGAMRKTDPESSIELWKPLVKGEYTLLDHFERGGKRYVIAVENAPSVKADGLSALSAREQQVVAAAASGRWNKLIAYELGISPSTVGVLLARAARRLGVKSRRELVAIYDAHQRASSQQT